MHEQDPQGVLASAQAGDPEALEFVVLTICEHLLEIDYENTIEFLCEQRLRILN